MQKVLAHDDDISTSASAYSDLSEMENETDTLGRIILRRERDNRILKAALDGSSILFNKAEHRIPLHKRLERVTVQGVAKQEIERKSRPVHPPSRRLQPLSKRIDFEKEWLRKPAEPVVEQVVVVESRSEPEVDLDAIVPHRTIYTGDEHWTSHDLLNGQDTPPSMQRRRQQSQQSSLLHMNSSHVDDHYVSDDLSSNGLPASSIAVNRERRPHLSLRERVVANQAPTFERFRASVPAIQVHEDVEDFADISDKENMPQELVEKQLEQRKVEQAPQRSRNFHSRLEAAMKEQNTQRDLRRTQEKQRSDLIAEQQQPKMEEAKLSTPVVTGGWIDTPKIERVESKQDQIKNSHNEVKPSTVGARQPLSVLHESSQTSNLSPHESIYDAPQALSQALPQALPPKTAKTKSPVGNSDKIAGPPTASSRPGVRDSLPELAAVQSAVNETKTIDEHIANAIASNGEAGRSERRAPRNDARLQRQSAAQTVQIPASTNIEGCTRCAHCGAYSSIWKGLFYETRDLFYFKDPTTGHFQVSWLGAAVLMFLAWYIAESLLCFNYCMPKYAVKMKDYGVDPNAPVFPFVIPTLLFRPFDFLLKPLSAWLAWFAGAAFHLIFGQDARRQYDEARMPHLTYLPNAGREAVDAAKSVRRSVQWSKTSSALTSTVSRRAVQSAVDAIDGIGRLWDDGYAA